jgi:hypothetical protein
MKNTFKFVVCFLGLFLTSCERDRLTVYSYNGVSLTRIDRDSETYFYYGDFRNETKLPNDYIKATYLGLNYVMQSYVIFNNDKTLTFVDMGDGVQKNGQSKFLNLAEYIENAKFIKWKKTFEYKFDSVLRIDDVLKIEKQINLENHSKVNAVYIR